MFLEIIRTFWPIAVVITPLVIGAGFLWLKTQFPSKADLDRTAKTMKSNLDEAAKVITERIDAHDKRLEVGSEKLSSLDRRVAVVERECESQPTKDALSQGQAVLAGRVSGVESALRGLERQVGTGNDLLQLLLEQGLKNGGGK